MSDVTRISSQIEQVDPQAAEKLLPLVYDELRKLAAAKLAQEKPGQTLAATALVHEAYLRLVGQKEAKSYRDRSHFFAAAAEAMRRILVERARRKRRFRHGGGQQRVGLEEAHVMTEGEDERVESMVEWCRSGGPRGAEVADVDVVWDEPQGPGEFDFSVR